MEKEGLSKYFFLAVLGVVGLASIIIVIPVLTSIIAGAILAFVFYPLYDKIRVRVKHKYLAAFLIAFMIILLVTIPSGLLVKSLAEETNYLYLRAKQQLFSGEIIENRCYEDTFICKSANNINNLLKDEATKSYLISLLNDVIGFITGKVSGVILALPSIALSLMVTLFTTFYLLVEGKDYLKRVTQIVPLKVHHQDQVIKQFSDVTYALIYGSFIVALVQGTLGAFGFWLFGINGFLWWGIVMTFFALVPFVGCAMIWMPAAGYMILAGYLQAEPTLMWQGLGLFFYGLLIISTIDNILKPIIVAGRANVHPLLVMIGVIGGLFIFGFIGLIIGPFVLVLFQTLLQIFEKERAPHALEEADILGHHNGKKRK
ncbi:AI-2E family transporter [Candidatus Woesearchaeota archaeon]|nr:AI-2E family transporter [Candidatus Woesearchaeota archaeon]